MKRHIPNIVTLINLFFGCCATASVLYGQFVPAFYFFVASGVADYLDGTLARVMGAGTAIGKQLDSLADMVSFGVVPGAILYMLLVKGFSGRQVLPIELTLAASPAFLVTLFAAIRLANFNIDTRQTENFIGMPTPSVAMFTAGLLLIQHYDSFGLAGLVCSRLFVYSTIPLLCWLMIAQFPMFSFKFKKLTWRGNEIRITFAATAVLLGLLLKEAAVSAIIVAYLFFTIINNFKNGWSVSN
ncbi:MAG TPA: CDP-diacylglycerol O-phosphatidyltransferase [Bacteroidetes bacterium]|nr:CDP-diacylglycerol O-phosphatidyltransferase [Bacteroidota bacterium]